MGHSKGFFAIFTVFILSGLISLSYFSEKARIVDIIGLFAGGATFGAGIVRQPRPHWKNKASRGQEAVRDAIAVS